MDNKFKSTKRKRKNEDLVKKKFKQSESKLKVIEHDHKMSKKKHNSYKQANKNKTESTDEVKSTTSISKRTKKKVERVTKTPIDVACNRENNVKEEEEIGMNALLLSNSTNNDVENENIIKNQVSREECNNRTLFVGNVITSIKKTQLLRLFSKYGQIQSIRLRCATPIHPGISKRSTVIRKLFHPKRATLHSYVTFEKREDALKAIELNGTKYKEHYLRIQICDADEKTDPSKTVFLGNLPFDVEDDDLWTAFEIFGAIVSVRVIRNAATGAGIGIGYINFQSPDSAELALVSDDIQIKNKTVRVKRYVKQKGKKHKTRPDNKKGSENSEFKNRTQKRKLPNQIAVLHKNSEFQGTKASQRNKKRKLNKGYAQKMKMILKIAPKNQITK